MEIFYWQISTNKRRKTVREQKEMLTQWVYSFKETTYGIAVPLTTANTKLKAFKVYFRLKRKQLKI